MFFDKLLAKIDKIKQYVKDNDLKTNNEKEIFQVVTLRSQENVLDTDVTIYTFDSLEEASEFLKQEKESILAEFLDFNQETTEIKEDSDNVFCIYNDDVAYGVKVELINLTKVVSISF